MFNRNAAFNRVPFNREFSIVIYASVSLNGEGKLTAFGNVTVSPTTALHGEGTLKASFIREIPFTATMDGEGTLKASFIRERLHTAAMHGIGILTASGAYYHLDELEFTGPFKPGDQIIIDSKNLTFTINGQNALHYMQGDFFDLAMGNNEIVYRDPATGRKVLFRISWRNKYV